jgi:serine/threonine-protein kinase
MGSVEFDTRTSLAEARVGETLKGKWCLDGLLGVGGMASVFSATHRNGKRVAIKMLHPEAALIPHVKARFLREGYVANRVGHPGAVSILDDDVDDRGIPFLVMEYLEGQNLDALAEQRVTGVTAGDALIIAHRMLDVLAAAHAKGIIHRDLKPANVFVERNGALRILDFGIARLGDAPSGGPADTGGLTLGTPGFMPPEQARGRSDEVGPETDLWALAALVFFLVTKRAVHEGGTAAEQVVAAATQPAPLLGDVNPNLPAALCRVVDHGLAYDRAQRYRTAAAMREAVAEAYAEIVGGPLSSLPPRQLSSLFPSSKVKIPTRLAFRDEPTLVAAEQDSSLPHIPAPPRTPDRLTPGLREPWIVSGQPRASRRPRGFVWPWTIGGLAALSLVAWFVARGAAPHSAQPAVTLVENATGAASVTTASLENPPGAAVNAAPDTRSASSAVSAPPASGAVSALNGAGGRAGDLGGSAPAITVGMPTELVGSARPSPRPPNFLAPRASGSAAAARAAAETSRKGTLPPERVEPAVRCDAPYFIDARGIKTVKPECL